MYGVNDAWQRGKVKLTLRYSGLGTLSRMKSPNIIYFFLAMPISKTQIHQSLQSRILLNYNPMQGH